MENQRDAPAPVYLATSPRGGGDTVQPASARASSQAEAPQSLWRQIGAAVMLIGRLGEHFKEAYEKSTEPAERAENERRTRRCVGAFVIAAVVIAGIELRRATSSTAKH